MKYAISITNPFRKRFFPWMRTRLALAGIAALATLLIAALAWDAYLFYRTNMEKRGAPSAAPSRARFSEDDLNEAIRLLDERAQKFNDTLRLTR